MLGHSISKLALSWRSKRILKKVSGVGSSWNTPWWVGTTALVRMLGGSVAYSRVPCFKI